MQQEFIEKLKSCQPGDTLNVFCFLPDGAFRTTLKIESNRPWRYLTDGMSGFTTYHMFDGTELRKTDEDHYEAKITFDRIRYNDSVCESVVIYNKKTQKWIWCGVDDEDRTRRWQGCDTDSDVEPTFLVMNCCFGPDVQCEMVECNSEGALELFNKVDVLNKRKLECIKETEDVTSQLTAPLLEKRARLDRQMEALKAEIAVHNRVVRDQFDIRRAEEDKVKKRFVDGMTRLLGTHKRVRANNA